MFPTLAAAVSTGGDWRRSWAMLLTLAAAVPPTGGDWRPSRAGLLTLNSCCNHNKNLHNAPRNRAEVMRIVKKVKSFDSFVPPRKIAVQFESHSVNTALISPLFYSHCETTVHFRNFSGASTAGPLVDMDKNCVQSGVPKHGRFQAGQLSVSIFFCQVSHSNWLAIVQVSVSHSGRPWPDNHRKQRLSIRAQYFCVGLVGCRSVHSSQRNLVKKLESL